MTRSMQADDLAAVGTLSVDTGWKLLVAFTHDHRQLATAIDTLGLPGLARQHADPLNMAFDDLNPLQAPDVGGGKYSGPTAAELREALRDILGMQRHASDDLARGRATKQLDSLGGIAQVLDSVRGRKHVLFFSEGFEPRLLTGNSLATTHDGSAQAASALDPQSAMGTGDAAVSGEIWKVDNNARFGSTAAGQRLTSALAGFQRSDATLDTVDIGGLRADGEVAPKAEGGTDTLATMAAETGGDFVRNANQLGGELQKVAARTSLVYLLIYSPKRLSSPGAFHKLRVEVKSPGARVLARSGYSEPKPYRSLSRLEQILSAGDLLTGGSRGAEISGHLVTAAFASPAEVPQVPVVLEISGPSLLVGDASEKSGVQIYAYANDASGALADYLASEVSLDLGALRKSLEAGGVKFYGTLYLPPGQYGVRVLVRNTTTGRAGVYSAAVEVPKIPGGPPAVLPPFFSEPAGRWLMVRGNPRSDAPPRPVDYPFAVAGESFIPSALPVLANGGQAQVGVFAYNLGAGAKPAALDVRSEIVGPDGHATPLTLTMTKSSDAERGGGRKLLLAFAPAGLAPGRYALRVALTDPVTHASAENSSAFEVK